MTLKTDMIELPISATLQGLSSLAVERRISRPALIFVHFWGGSYRTWLPIIQTLGSEYDICAPTLRGGPGSTLMAGSTQGKPFSMSSHAADITALIHYFQAKCEMQNGVILIGHSMGGKIVQRLLTQRDLPIKGVVLLGPAPSSGFELPGAMREQQTYAYDSLESANFVVRNVLLGTESNVTDDVAEALAADAVAWDADAKAAWPAYGMAEEFSDELIGAVRGRRLQVRVLVGAQDRVETPDNVRAKVVQPLSEAGLEIRCQVIEGSGHMLPVEAIEAVSQSIRALM